MSEKTEIKETALPEAQGEKKSADTTPSTENNSPKIPVKFNKEIHNLSVEDAAVLAQKGLKYEAIEEDYAKIKALAKEEDKSVPEFLNQLKSQKKECRQSELTEKCGGDKDLALHIMDLEEKAQKNGSDFDEVRENFPEIKEKDNLPSEVLEKSELRGTKLLDEYLRYLLAQKKAEKIAEQKQKSALKSSTGSLANRTAGTDPETEEFLKGLWK